MKKHEATLQCYPHYNSGCPGAKNDNCYPNIIWSGTVSGSGYYDRYLNSGTFNQETDRAITYAFSVRCVPDLNCKLQLCDGASGSYGVLQCRYKNGGCPGSNDNNCRPHIVWSGEAVPSKSGYYYNGNLNSGTFNATTDNYNISTRANSVRCVLDLNTKALQTAALRRQLRLRRLAVLL